METGERPEHVATGESAQSGADRRIDEGRYREDPATIRALVAEHDDQPLLEHWAFIAWGLLIAAGLLVLFAAPATPRFFLLAGLAVGVTYAACGIHRKLLERRRVG
ncbi:MAG: hypothetical protein ACLFPO_01895 [Spirochaetaceae bacterium]